jgi:hypothetical protein
VTVYRGYFSDTEQMMAADPGLILPLPGCHLPHAGPMEVTRIPLRLYPGEAPPFGPQDIELHTGDILFIEARDTEVFYAGGLLPSGEYALPRDYDLDVVEAVMQIAGPIVNGGINSNNLSGSIVAPGMGSPSPKLVTVVRRTPDNRHVPIRVDLHMALRDPRENLILQSGDVVILQETRSQALARYFIQVTRFGFFSELLSSSRSSATAAAAVP